MNVIRVCAALQQSKIRLPDNSGSALIVLALVISVPLLLEIDEIGLLVYASAEMESAAHAGALYSMCGTSIKLSSTLETRIPSVRTEPSTLRPYSRSSCFLPWCGWWCLRHTLTRLL